MPIKYVSTDTTPLFLAATGSKKQLELLWGDRVEVTTGAGSRWKAKARGKSGFVDKADVGDESLLEIYFIDVGQGDGVLIRTPDDRHVMIDGGYKRASQPTGKNAADFVDWKFFKDYGRTQIHLDAMLVSHNDADHYGGLSDLLDVGAIGELDASDVRVDAFYHAGVAWWVKPGGGRWLGPQSADGRFLTQLMGNRTSVVNALKPNAAPKLQGEWATLMERVRDAKTAAGSPTPIARLSDQDVHVPGFDGTGGGVAMRILAPVEKTSGGKPARHRFNSQDSKNTNGNSLLLRLDYGRARILLTGDLNTLSQRTLLDDYTGQRLEFECDVAKGCHHGSDDVSYEFLAAMRPAVTIISSGDNEGHDHPRPAIVAASATTGYLQISNDKLVSPLVYSTELARSIALGKPQKVTIDDGTSVLEIGKADLGTVSVDSKVVKVGDLNPTTVTRTLDKGLVVAGLIYGLVNVRTDGDRILCATLNEKDDTWQVRTIQSRF